jgi:hypothetical protein
MSLGTRIVREYSLGVFGTIGTVSVANTMPVVDKGSVRRVYVTTMDGGASSVPNARSENVVEMEPPFKILKSSIGSVERSAGQSVRSRYGDGRAL